LIGGYGFFSPVPEAFKNDKTLYDVILIQRAVPEYLYLALFDIGLPFVLDVDDNLLGRASYRYQLPELQIRTGLRTAAAVTVPNSRILDLLEQYCGLVLRHKAFITPNALPFPVKPRDPSQPEQIYWIQSDTAALTRSEPAVVEGIENFSRKYHLPVVLVGKSVLARTYFSNQVEMGEIDFHALLQLLEFGPCSIGVAPLETEADAETLDFVAGKSDLKILLFGGYGHPGVYSAAPPYLDSDLRTYAHLVGNSCAEWNDALEFQFREGWQSIAEKTRYIRTARHVDRIARENWHPALQACVLPKPIPGAQLYEVFRAAYLSMKGSSPDLTDENEHLEQKISELKNELATIRNSYSWRITKPLRTIAKPLMEKS
jgi:hypothetical protein